MSTDPSPIRSIRSILIANRGEIARRIIRTAREMGIRTIAVYSEPDRLAPHVQEADVAVPIGGYAAAESYLNRSEIMKAAEWQGVDAIHPGYGFLAESAAFARAVIDAGLVWIGPPPDAIAEMGDKIVAKLAATELGVPVLPSAELAGTTPSEWARQVADIGYPLMIKAAAGGGGRGMRVVESPDDLTDSVKACQREAAASFGNGTVFAERFLRSPRHIEIQILADAHGQVVHLGERECSIQRRHQKLVEEAPSAVVGDALRRRMAAVALELARSISYVGAGTVELLVDGSARDPGADLADDTPFWFLEMNTRLQVEHAVTEEVTGLDLVRAQIEIARGEPLRLSQDDIRLDGHAIEVRVYAEDPADDWMPSTGVLHRWRHGPTPGIRYDDGVETGSIITPHYDALLSKVITHAPTREEAAARLGRALRELQIHGVATNRDHLVDILDEPDFLAGDTTTDWIERHPAVPADDDPARYEREWQRFNALVGPHLAAAVLADPRQRRAGEGVWPFAPTGWRNVGGSVREMRPGETTWRITQTPSGFASQTVSLVRRGEQWDVTYSRVNRDHPLAVKRRAEDTPGPPVDHELYNVTISGPTGHTPTLVELIPLDDEVTLVHFGRRGHRCTVQVVDDTVYVNSALGQSVFTEVPRFSDHGVDLAASGPTAPVPGRVVSIEVTVGDVVAAGDTLVVLEAMKVEHRITAGEPGVVAEVLVATGDNVEAHQVLARLEAAG